MSLKIVEMFEQIILNLTIISKIPKGGRITKDSQGNISLENEAVTQPFYRWVWSQSRSRNLLDIQKVKNDAFEKAADLMENKFLNIFKHTKSPAESELEEHSRRVDQLNTLANALTSSLKGIENLSATYASDATTLSGLSIMHTEIEEKVIAIKKKIEDAHYKYVNDAPRPKPPSNNDSDFD